MACRRDAASSSGSAGAGGGHSDGEARGNGHDAHTGSAEPNRRHIGGRSIAAHLLINRSQFLFHFIVWRFGNAGAVGTGSFLLAKRRISRYGRLCERCTTREPGLCAPSRLWAPAHGSETGCILASEQRLFNFKSSRRVCRLRARIFAND